MTTDRTLPASVRPRRPRRALHLALAIVALVVGSGVFAVSTASADASFGPHGARYEVTLDRRLVVDLGPLGTIQMPSPAPRPLGVHVVVGEIPDDVQAVDDSTSVAALAGEADKYLQFFADPDAVVSQVVTGLAQDAARRFALCLLGAAAVTGAGAVLVGRERGRVLVVAATPWTGPAAAGVIVVLVLGSVVVGTRPMPLEGRPSTALAQTSFSDVRVTGRLAGAVDSFGATLVKMYRDNEAYYAEADANLVAAWDARDADGRLAALEPPGTSGFLEGEPGAETSPDESSGAETSAEDGPGAGSDADQSAEPDVVTMLVVADIHCNTGMSPLIRTAVERSGASIVLHAGDATIDGTGVEKICVTSVTKAARGTTVVFAGGNHDSAETAAQFAAAGAVVLRGSTQTVDGVTFLGDLDPYESRSGQPYRLVGPTTEQEEVDALETAACEQRPDILLVHTPRVGMPVLESGCVPYQISGHLHRRVGPEADGPGVLYVNSSTAGAVENQLTVGELHGTAEMTVLRYDRANHRMLDYRVVQVMTDRSATVGPWTPYPQPTGTEDSGAEEPSIEQPGTETPGTETPETGTLGSGQQPPG